MKMYVHVPYIYVLGTVRQCKEDFVTVQLNRASLLIPGICLVYTGKSFLATDIVSPLDAGKGPYII